MKIYYIGILRNLANQPAFELCVERDFSQLAYFTRGPIRELASVITKNTAETTVVARNEDSARRLVKDELFNCHAFARAGGIVGIIVSDKEYPSLVAQQLLSKILDEFTIQYKREVWATTTKELSFRPLNEYMQTYQNPEKVDSIMKIQNELAETKTILSKTIESVLERGEKLDNLVAKSDGLSMSSRMFYTQARKQNSCCVMM